MADRKQANRIQWVDLAKGICMILVVWIHVRIHYRSFHFVKFNWVALVCYYFRMPLYFFLSGLFFKTYDSYRTFLSKKVNNLAIPFVVSATIAIAIQALRLYFTEGTLTRLPDLAVGFYPIGPIWFLLCLFWINQLFYGAHTLTKGVWWILYPLCIGLGVLGFNTNILPFWLHFEAAFTALPFFVAGYAMRQHTTFLHDKPRYINDVVLVAALIVLLNSIAHKYHAHILFDRNTYRVPLWALYVGGLMGTYAVFLVSRIVRWLPIISYIGRYSIIVLITHHAIIAALSRPTLARIVTFCGSGKTAVVLTTLAILLLSVPIIYLCKRFLPHIFAQKPVIK